MVFITQYQNINLHIFWKLHFALPDVSYILTELYFVKVLGLLVVTKAAKNYSAAQHYLTLPQF